MNNESDMKRGVSSVNRHYNPSILSEADPHEGMDEIALRELICTLKSKLTEIESALKWADKNVWMIQKFYERWGETL